LILRISIWSGLDGTPMLPPLGDYLAASDDHDNSVIQLLLRYGAQVRTLNKIGIQSNKVRYVVITSSPPTATGYHEKSPHESLGTADLRIVPPAPTTGVGGTS